MFTYIVTDDCSTVSLTATFTVAPAEPIVLDATPTDPDLTACTPLADIQSAYSAWVAAFGYSDGCNASDNIADVPELPENVACAGADLLFTYIVTDDCGTKSLTATFTVAPADPIVLDATPADPDLTACTTLADIQSAYSAWVAAFGYSDGCNASDNIADVPTLPANVACAGADLMFTYIVTDDCSTVSLTATFTVAPAPAVTLTVPANYNGNTCMTQNAVDAAFADWLAQATMTNAGCGGVLTRVPENPAAPSFCGGSTQVTWTVTSDCEVVSQTRTFSIPSSPMVLIVPDNYTGTTCMTQDEVNNHFTEWLAEVSLTGGCNAILTVNPEIPMAPDACGGSVTVQWTVNSACEDPVIQIRSFSIPNAPAVSLTLPDSFSTTECMTQDDINTAFTNWLSQVNVKVVAKQTW
jgi:hypothetical protein